MRYLITGHTGFKGAWLTLLLASRGHSVSGYSLDPAAGSLFELGKLSELLAHDVRADIRDAGSLTAMVREIQPEVVIHLAAQPLVRESYRNPRETFETNAMGTLNVLEATQQSSSLLARLIITTDKVYRNVDRVAGYVESDALGGHDPYSSSKAMADILTQSWVASFPGVTTAIARAGNVIGGGDVSPDRLLPDLLRSFAGGVPADIRYPGAVRPWQHVLDCLNGYLLLVDSMVKSGQGGEWNFGPGPENFIPVGELADLAADIFGPGAIWTTDGSIQPHEANLLALDASKANAQLAWRDKLDFDSSVRWTVDWQKAVSSGKSAREITSRQIAEFEAIV